MPKPISLFFAALMLCAGSAPAGAGESETFTAAQDFISALTDLDAALQRLHDLTKTDKLDGTEVEPLCATLRPDAKEEPDAPMSLSDLLKKDAISREDAGVLCDALGAVRSVSERAKSANLRAATECKAYRVPACDIANEVVAAERDARVHAETRSGH